MPTSSDRRPHPVDDQLRDRHVVADARRRGRPEGVLQVGQELLRAAAGRGRTARGSASSCSSGTDAAPGQGPRRVAGQHPEQEEVDDQHEEQAPERAQQPCRGRSARSCRRRTAGWAAAVPAPPSVGHGRSLPRRPPWTAGASRTPPPPTSSSSDRHRRRTIRTALLPSSSSPTPTTTPTAPIADVDAVAVAGLVGRAEQAVVEGAVLHEQDAAGVRLRLEAGEPVGAEGLAVLSCTP